ncbi:MAG: hypothetical protein WC979_01635 [Candidatus Pacearchaeota archaeon]|jgi:hypothetical protein|nr:pentapeptide repeat-containing protein [Clostridia bacterium]
MKYTEDEILNSSKIGFEFEFLTKEEPLIVARSLTETLGIKVVVPMNVDSFNSPELKYHTPVTTTANLFKIESDFSGGKDCKELITGPLPFADAKIVLLKVLKWIDENAWTTERTAIQLNISFDAWKIKMQTPISHMNKVKFCLGFNEEFVWKRFPNRKDSVYAKSIKNMVINSIFDIGVANANSQFTVAPTKYYAVNLTKAPLNYIEFRFLGGADYQKKKQDILEVLEFSITSLYTLSQTTTLNQNDITKLNKILDDHKKYLDCYKNPELFKKTFPHINLTFDMKNDIQTLKSSWSHVNDMLFKFLVASKCEKMDINYDSEIGALQIKDADLQNVECFDLELVHCTGYGIFTRCKFYNCEMDKTHFIECDVIKDNTLKGCKVENTNVQKSNLMQDCYVANDGIYIIDCKMEEGVFRKGKKGANADISPETSIVSITEDKPKRLKGTFGVYKEPNPKDYKQAKILKATKGKGKR